MTRQVLRLLTAERDALQARLDAMVPLTDAEISDIWDAQIFHVTDKLSATQFVRDIEAALGIAVGKEVTK